MVSTYFYVKHVFSTLIKKTKALVKEQKEQIKSIEEIKKLKN